MVKVKTLLWVLLIYSNLINTSDCDDGSCPKLGSPKCRVDCTADSYDILCVENLGEWPAVRNDLDKLGALGHSINAYFWNIAQLNFQVETNLFGKALNLIERVSLMNIPHMQHFPMLRDIPVLKSLVAIDMPALANFAPELLPPSIASLTLFNTGITRLETDFAEVMDLGNLTSFVFQKANLSFIGSNFFKVFSQITHIEMEGNTFVLTDIQRGTFTTAIPLGKFIMRRNNFSGMNQDDRTSFMVKTILSLNTSEISIVDLSDNKLEFEQETVNVIPYLQPVKELYLQGNRFKNSMSITDSFVKFNNLRILDLSRTNMPISPGTFSALAALDTLRISGNPFGDMTAVDMFKGSNSTMLRILDLSYVSLTGLPDGDIELIGEYLEELDLTGNNLLPVEFPQYARLINASKIPKPTFSPFPELRYLGLGSNNWTFFDGQLLAPLQVLETVDLSCNWFHHITKEFFANMPQSLDLINITFCVPTTSDAPFFEPDAFTTLPPIKTLILAQGSLRNWIFTRLSMMPDNTMKTLENVLLQENNIRFVDGNKMNFPGWKVLNLRKNTLQSLGDSSFQHLKSLRTLILSNNQLISVDPNDFIGLSSLKRLDLHGNKLVNIESGTFDMLINLQILYLGENNISALTKLFGPTAGGGLLHLGLQKNPIGCITRTELDPLKSLRWLYLHDITTPVFIDRGDEVPLRQKIYTIPFASGDKLDCDPQFDSPVLHPTDDVDLDVVWETDFIRLIVDNPWDLAPRTFYAHVAKCFTQMDRNLTNITGNFLCSMGDLKTAGTVRIRIDYVFVFAVSTLLALLIN